jgi:hypothetical protein
MPKTISIFLLIAVAVATSVAASSKSPTATALVVQKLATASAILIPVAWVMLELFGKLRRAWRRFASRPYM